MTQRRVSIVILVRLMTIAILPRPVWLACKDSTRLVLQHRAQTVQWDVSTWTLTPRPPARCARRAVPSLLMGLLVKAAAAPPTPPLVPTALHATHYMLSILHEQHVQRAHPAQGRMPAPVAVFLVPMGSTARLGFAWSVFRLVLYLPTRQVARILPCALQGQSVLLRLGATARLTAVLVVSGR